jgi:pyruvate/2-oxoglutarate dehydrogenase complex dihydrolipoamide dehydrogenase (E3) component
MAATIAGSHLLVAAGPAGGDDRRWGSTRRASRLRCAKGVAVDSRLRTTNRRVFAIGDAAGGLQFTHVAGYHAGVVIRVAAVRPAGNGADRTTSPG